LLRSCGASRPWLSVGAFEIGPAPFQRSRRSGGWVAAHLGRRFGATTGREQVDEAGEVGPGTQLASLDASLTDGEEAMPMLDVGPVCGSKLGVDGRIGGQPAIGGCSCP
jgi:hypothetical protein